MMNISKRDFLKATGVSLIALSTASQASSDTYSTLNAINKSKNDLPNITSDVMPISSAERKARIVKAQQFMQQFNIAALILEPGAAMDYFTGIQWWRSERMTAVVIPKEGDIAVVCPFFEEPSIRESMRVGDDVRVWQEHENPFKMIKQVLSDRGLTKGKLAFEQSVRYFVLQGIMSQLPAMQDVTAEPVTRGCRIIKTQHELKLMHKANEVTLRAYADVYAKLAIGMTGADVKKLMTKAQSDLGGKNIWNMALINEASAFPHGTKQQQTIREGSIVLMDCGCSVQGYQSDISRTFVVGQPTKQQEKIWHTVRQGQEIAFEKAQIGTPAGLVDDAVRQYYQSLGFGPDYKLPGLSHRTGHGIGMKGHEGVNFVHGEKEKLKEGMCFSNEPGIYIPGKFGVRIEDCIYMTEKGAQWFTIPPESLSSPLGRLAKI
jgi:Xaa-Pro dipeptidase